MPRVYEVTIGKKPQPASPPVPEVQIHRFANDIIPHGHEKKMKTFSRTLKFPVDPEELGFNPERLGRLLLPFSSSFRPNPPAWGRPL